MGNTLTLLGFLCVLVVVSAFFSASETGLMAMNRYRLKHLVRKKHPTALRVDRLLNRPDRTLGVILIGNTFANILASSLATLLAVQLFGDVGILIATISLTLIVLVFSEVMPKTLAAIHARATAFFVALPLQVLLTLLYPLVWMVNGISNGFLKLLGVTVGNSVLEPLSQDDLQAVLGHSNLLPHRRNMLLGILNLDALTVNEIMVHKKDIVGIDLNKATLEIPNAPESIPYTRLLVYKGDVNQVCGFVHSRVIADLLRRQCFDKTHLLESMDVPYFIPEGTLLSTQLVNFQQQSQRAGLVVDEYGDVQGLVTLSDILEEIVGKFGSDDRNIQGEIKRKSDGSYLVPGDIPVRDLNRVMGWQLPTNGLNTLSGSIVNYLEMMPEAGMGLRLGGYPIEIITVSQHKVCQAKIMPGLADIQTTCDA